MPVGYCYDALCYKFNGKERDSESGLDDLDARYCASALGRMMSADPLYFQSIMLINPQRFNLYAYGRNNPLKWIDPTGEKLFLMGDLNWLLASVLYRLAGGQDEFNKYFHIENGQVLLNAGVDPSSLSGGLKLISELVGSSDNYVYYAGTSGEGAASLFTGTFKDNGKLTGQGKSLRDRFQCGLAGCGTIVAVRGRPLESAQPATLANGDPVYMVIAYNTGVVGVEKDVSYKGVDYETIPDNVVSAEIGGLGKPIPPVGLFIHESAEALAFKAQGDWDYPHAHSTAILREASIREELHIGGGFAGAAVEYKIPH